MYRQSSGRFSRSVVSNSLRPHGLQQARLPCLSPTPGAYSNSCLLHWSCHPTISFSVIPFSSHLQSFPESGSFPMSWLFASGGQSIGVSASASVLPVNIQDWSPLGWTGLILQSKGLSRVFSSTTVQNVIRAVESSPVHVLTIYITCLTNCQDYQSHLFAFSAAVLMSYKNGTEHQLYDPRSTPAWF